MYLHTAFGLIIESPFVLPAETLNELAPTEQVDVTIVCQEFLEARRYSYSQDCSISTAPGEVVMRWEDVGEFRLCAGKKIVIRRRPGVSDDILTIFLSGSVFAMLLYQRGMTILHGSVVSIKGQSVAFVAPKGFGKSSLAMALHKVGARLISDDLVAIPPITSIPVVTIGFAQAKLWPDSLVQLGYSTDQHVKLRDEVEKRGIVVSCKGQEPLPLCHIFILGKGRELTFFPLNKNQALFTLMPHWYLSRYGTATIKELDATASQFSQCLDLVAKVPVTALVRPESLTELQHLAEMVLSYVAPVEPQ